nr:MAG TPA: hypothetical protein [Caudoviricetes sp.]
MGLIEKNLNEDKLLINKNTEKGLEKSKIRIFKRNNFKRFAK